MNLPGLPTDNLYKFLALSGVCLLLVTPFYFLKFNDEYFDKEMQYAQELSTLDLEYKYLNEDVNSLHGDVEVLDEAVKSNDKKIWLSPKLSNQFRDDALKYQAKNEELQAKGRELEIKHVRISLIGENRKYLKIKADLAKSTYEFCIVLGLILTFCGFIWWYFKLQVHLDRYVAVESKRHTKDTKE